MSAKHPSEEQLLARTRKHAMTIRRVASLFYPPFCYSFNELVCDLTTFLWQVYSDMPADVVIFREEAWAYSVLYRFAVNYVRGENRHQSHYDYGADMTGFPSDDGGNPMVRRMYRLIGMLDADDQEIIMMYLDKVPVSQIATEKGMGQRRTYRRIIKIRDELCWLNNEMEDDDDMWDANDGNSDDDKV